MEQIQRFPAGYFAMIVSPVKIFRYRGALSVWKLILIFLFLNACLIAPLSLSFARAGNISLEQVAPHLNAAIQTGYTGQHAVLSFQNGVLQSGNAWTKEHGDTIISFDPRKTTAVSESRYHTKVRITKMRSFSGKTGSFWLMKTALAFPSATRPETRRSRSKTAVILLLLPALSGSGNIKSS